jgi:hypothetical protein
LAGTGTTMVTMITDMVIIHIITTITTLHQETHLPVTLPGGDRISMNHLPEMFQDEEDLQATPRELNPTGTGQEKNLTTAFALLKTGEILILPLTEERVMITGGML